MSRIVLKINTGYFATEGSMRAAQTLVDFYRIDCEILATRTREFIQGYISPNYAPPYTLRTMLTNFRYMHRFQHPLKETTYFTQVALLGAYYYEKD